VKMWSGRFHEPLDPLFEQWQRSLPFDWQLLPEEVAASKAHALGLEAAGILTQEERETLHNALDLIASRFHAADNSGPAWVASNEQAEDIHHFVELQLVATVQELGLKLHTGRSRNEQIATDLRLYVRSRGQLLQSYLGTWAEILLHKAKAAGEAVMPAYTHLQRAEPVLVAHWLTAYAEMLLRDVSRMENCVARANFCPLGSGAVAGATLALDRTIASKALDFTAPAPNSMDATSDRDFVLEYLQTLTIIALHASRFAEEITLFATAEFGFVELPEAFSTGSSAMPQKKNPDLTELVRGKAGRINGAAQAVTMQLKGLPLAYNKDLQETQEPLFQATIAMHQMLHLLAKFTYVLSFHTDRMQKACETGFMNAMAAATYLVHKGVPFRTAHEKIGNAVRYCLEKGCELGDLSLDELRTFGDEFGEDFFDAVTLEATIDCHDVLGGTARSQVRASLAGLEKRIQELLDARGRIDLGIDTATEVSHADS